MDIRPEVKTRLIKVNKTQRSLCDEIRADGVSIMPADLNNYLSGVVQTPKAEMVIEMVYSKLSKWEEESSAKS